MLRRTLAAITAAVMITGLIGTAAQAHPAVPAPDPLRGAVNLPPGGKVDFIIGQDADTVAAFDDAVLDVDPRFPRPAGVSLFTSLNGLTPLNGIWSPVDYGVGTADAEEMLSAHRGAVTVGVEMIDYSQNLGSPARNLTARAIAGADGVPAETVERYRAWVDDLIRWADASRREVFLKLGYEFDGHWNAYDPESYTAAFRYVAQRIDELGADRVATVWQSASWAGAIPDGHLLDAADYRAAEAVVDGRSTEFWDRWYPGDDAVDWVGISQFATGSFDREGGPWSCDRDGVDSTVASPRAVQEAMLDYARAHGKPAMIAEAAPQGYDLGELTTSCIFASGSPAPYEKRTTVTVDEVWDEWFAPTFAFVRQHRDVIRSLTYINTDWDSQSRWACTGAGACASGYWGDSRLQANEEILDRVGAELRDRGVWTRGAWASWRFESADLSQGVGVEEAEYGEADTWLDCCGLGGLPQTNPAASNGREVMVMNFGDGGSGTYGVDFEQVGRGDEIRVRLGSLPEGEGADATFSVLVDGRRVARQPVPRTGAGVYEEIVIDARTRPWSTVRVQLDPNDGGQLMWLDRIVVG